MSLSFKRAKRAADALKTWQFPWGWLSEPECPRFAASPKVQATGQLAFIDLSSAWHHSRLTSFSSFSLKNPRPSSSYPSSPVDEAKGHHRNSQNGACAPPEESNFEAQKSFSDGTAQRHQPASEISSHQARSQSLLNGLRIIPLGESEPWGRTTHSPLSVGDEWRRRSFGQASWALQRAALVHTTATSKSVAEAVTALMKEKGHSQEERARLEGARVLQRLLHDAGLVAPLKEAPNKRPRGQPRGSKSKPRQQSDDVTPAPPKKRGRPKSEHLGRRPSPATPAFETADLAAPSQSGEVTTTFRGFNIRKIIEYGVSLGETTSAPIFSHIPWRIARYMGTDVRAPSRTADVAAPPQSADVRAPPQSADVTAPSLAPRKRGRPKRRAADQPPVHSTPAMQTGVTVTSSQTADVSPALQQAAEPTSRSATADIRPSSPQDAQAPSQSADVTPAAPAPKRRGRLRRQALAQEPVSVTAPSETLRPPHQSADIIPGSLIQKRRGRPKDQAPFSTAARSENADVTPAPSQTVAPVPRKRGRPKRQAPEQQPVLFKNAFEGRPPVSAEVTSTLADSTQTAEAAPVLETPRPEQRGPAPPVLGGADLSPAPPQAADVTAPRPRQKRLAMGQQHVPAAKTCSVCGVTRPARDFAWRLTSPDGLAFRCRGCDAVQSYVNHGKVFPGLAVASKQCAHCKELKEGTFFSALGSSPDGLGPRCRSCSAALSARRLAHLAASRAWNAPPEKTTCAKCGKELPTRVFHRDDYALSGRASVCPACSYEKVKKRRRLIEMVPAPMVEAKRCGSCREVKKAGEFFCHSWSTDGLMYVCKECTKASRRLKVAAAGGGA